MNGVGSLAKGSFAEPSEVRGIGHGRLELLDLTGAVVGRFVLEPGWRWSRDVRPLTETDTCQQPHVGYVLAGRMRVVMDDGAVGEAGPGDVFRIDPGHDAWTVSDEPVILLDFTGAATYAVPDRTPCPDRARCTRAPPTPAISPSDRACTTTPSGGSVLSR